MVLLSPIILILIVGKFLSMHDYSDSYYVKIYTAEDYILHVFGSSGKLVRISVHNVHAHQD